MVQFKTFLVSTLSVGVVVFATAHAGGEQENLIVDFSVPQPSLKMKTVNDPVMGGKSFSSCSLKDGGLMWEGEVKIVPFLHAPGFCNLETTSFSAGNVLAAGKELCFLVDPAKSSLLSPMSVRLSSGRQWFRGSGKSYSAELKESSAERQDGLAEHCAALDGSSFKSSWRGQVRKSDPPLDKGFLEKVSQMSLSTYSSKKAGAFTMQIIKVYASSASDEELELVLN